MNCPNCHCHRGEPLTVAVNSLVTRCHHAFHAVATAEAPPLNEPLHPQSPVTPDDFAQQKPAQDAKACPTCNSTFVPTKRLKKYCSAACVRAPKPLDFGFWEKVDKHAEGGCWVWTGTRQVFGYGISLRYRLAHRVSWEIANGPIPDGLWVLHRCDNPPCVNPAHLFLGTQTENMRDMTAKGRHPHSRRTTCKNGHPFDRLHMHRGRLTRVCSVCAKASQQRRATRRGSA